jgi:hypothetical protein
MRHALAAVILLSLPLAGCLTPSERLQERAREAQAANDARDDQQCRSYGAQPGSDVYVNCRAQMTAARISAPGPVMVSGAPAAPAYRDPPPPVTCMRTGTMVTCN